MKHIWIFAILFAACASEQETSTPKNSTVIEVRTRTYPLATEGWRIHPDGTRGSLEPCSSGNDFIRFSDTYVKGTWNGYDFVNSDFKISYGRRPRQMGGGCIITVYKNNRLIYEIESSCPE